MNYTKEKKLQTKKNLSRRQYQNMGEFKFTTREKNHIDLEKMLSLKTELTQPEVKTEIEVKNVNVEKPLKAAETISDSAIKENKTEAEQIVEAVVSARKYIVEEVSANFEKKLERLDDAIVELISCKTENERLKGKIDNLTRENYKLKREIKRYKSIMPGLFIKLNKDGIEI